MTEAGKRLIEAAQEAVAVAKGEIPAAAIYHNGHKYVPAAELEMLTGSGIVEVAVRNPNVAEYMRHWESRALTAEAAIERLEREAELPRVGALAAIADIREVTGLGAKTLLSRYAFERDEARQQRDTAEAELEKVREALKPFAAIGQYMIDEGFNTKWTMWGFDRNDLTYGDFRAAARALSEPDKEGT